MKAIINFLKNLFNFEKVNSKEEKTIPEINTKPQTPIRIPEKYDLPKPQMEIIFPDISHYEKCEFNLFKGSDLLTKATEGIGFIDNTLNYNMNMCKNKNIRFGVYHFYRVGQNPITQADFFIKTVGLDNLKNFFYAPIVDFETSKFQTIDALKKDIPNLKIFIERIIEIVGRTPIFYSYTSLLEYLDLDVYFTKCPLWIAKYGKEPNNNQILPWNKYWAWQYSDGEISNKDFPTSFIGIGKCDSNIIKANKV